MNTKSTFFCIATAAVFLNASYAQDYDKTIDGSAGPVDAHSAADLTGPSGLLSKLDLGSTDAANPAIINILDDITFAATEGTADQRLATPFAIDPDSWNHSTINEYRYAKIDVAKGKTLTISGNAAAADDSSDAYAGGAVRWGAGNLEIGSSGDNAGRIAFRNNSAKCGGAVYAGGNTELTIQNTDFEYNKTIAENNEANGGAIASLGNLHIYNSNFTNNSSDANEESTFAANLKGGAVYLKSAIYNATKTVFIENSAFSGNTAFNPKDNDDGIIDCFGYGGAVYVESKSSQTIIKNSTFTNNKTTGAGGAIYTEGQLVLENTDFTGNRDVSQEMNGGNGGAIFADGSIKITGGKFEDNFAHSGGAIAWSDFSGGEGNLRILNIEGTKFVNNRSNSTGGAIISHGNVKIVNAEFVGNESNGSGGAMFSNTSRITENDPEGYTHSFYIENSVFRENRTVKNETYFATNGGAISYQAAYQTQLNGIIKDTAFLDNSAVYDGGAVYAHGDGKLKFEVSSGKNLVSKGNAARSGGFLDMGSTLIIPDGPQSEWPEDWENNRTESPEVIFEIGSNATYTIGSAADRIKDDIAGTGILRKTGKGVLILNANNERLYTQTIVDEGRLVVNGILGGSGGIIIGDVISKHSLTVNNGGTLGGSGRISSETTINVGGVIAPGNSSGTITFDKLILNDGAILDIEKGDLIVADELDLSNIVNGVELNFTGFSQGDTVRFLEIRDIIGIDLETENLNDYFIANGFDFYFDADTNSIIANYVVPEPATAAAILGVFALAFAAYKRRK